jgi:hypothetical protein
VDFSPQVNYTDWTTATGRHILVQTFADRRVPRGQRGGIPTAINLFSRPEPLLLLWRSSSCVLTRWVDPVPDSLLQSGSAGNWTRDLCVCSQELWPLDRRGGQHYNKRHKIQKSTLSFRRADANTGTGGVQSCGRPPTPDKVQEYNMSCDCAVDIERKVTVWPQCKAQGSVHDEDTMLEVWRLLVRFRHIKVA